MVVEIGQVRKRIQQERIFEGERTAKNTTTNNPKDTKKDFEKTLLQKQKNKHLILALFELEIAATAIEF